MTYLLGVDVGTTYTAAAVVTGGRAEVVPLGNRSSVIPTVVFLGEDEHLLVGEAAHRRSLTDPSRVAREFKRRVGDTVPILLGNRPLSPQSLMARTLGWVVDHVSQQLGEQPSHVAASHPANWGPYKLDLFEQAVRMADLTDCTTITEPEAAAAYYASHERMTPGETIAVYDLGGGTFDAAVVKRTEVGFDILGVPEGIEHLGGIDIDEAVFGFVRESRDGAVERLDPDDPASLAAVGRLRQECVEAKEALSTDVEASIPVLLPSVQTQLQLTRVQLEDMIRPLLGDTVTALRRALRSAEMAPDDIRAVLLVGGSSRIPLVAEMVSAELGRPVAVDTHPKHSVALGTVLAAEEAVARHQGRAPETIAVVAPRPTPAPDPAVLSTLAAPVPHLETAADQPVAGSDGEADLETDAMAVPTDVAEDIDPGTPEAPVVGQAGRRDRRAVVLVSLVAVALVVGIGVAMALRGGGDTGIDDTPTDPGVPPSEVAEDLPTDPTVACEELPCIQIDQVIVNNDELQADWTAFGFEPDIAGTHAHFYWNVYDSHQAGSNAEALGHWPAPWELTDQQPFVPDEAMRLATFPAYVDAICVTVADADHAVVNPNNHHCVPLPDEANHVARCHEEPCIKIEVSGVEIVDGELVVDWSPLGFAPDTADIHAHFFWGIYDSYQVGTNASDFDLEQAPWELTDEIPFVPRSEMRLANRPDDAQTICVTVADGNHAVIHGDNFHCVPLPDGA